MNPKQKDAAPKASDRREDTRLATRLDAIVDDVRYGALTFTASGFSRSGAFLQRRDGDTPLPMIGSLIEIVFRWPLETQIPPVRVQATVVRQTDNGVGVQFEIAA